MLINFIRFAVARMSARREHRGKRPRAGGGNVEIGGHIIFRQAVIDELAHDVAFARDFADRAGVQRCARFRKAADQIEKVLAIRFLPAPEVRFGMDRFQPRPAFPRIKAFSAVAASVSP